MLLSTPDGGNRMIYKILAVGTLAFSIFCLPAQSQGYSEAERSGAAIPELTVSTGGDQGTYFRFGVDISKLAAQSGINLQVAVSKGSPDNLKRIASAPQRYHLGITQADVMDAVIAASKLGSSSQGIFMEQARLYKMVAPLYIEEVHVIAKRSSSLQKLSDLNGKIVAFGSPVSGHHTTANVLFRNMNIVPIKSNISNTAEAINAVASGDIDAAIYVAGAPSQALNEHPRRSELKLLNVTRAPVSQSYAPVVIDNSKYPWLPQPVSTIGVKAILVTTDHTGPICSAIGKISCLVRENPEFFNSFGHPKWKEVSGTAFAAQQVGGWPISDCVSDYLARGESCSVQNNSITPATFSTISFCDVNSYDYNMIACANHIESERLYGKK